MPPTMPLAALESQSSPPAPPVIRVDDQIANDLDPISFVILDLHAYDFLNQDYQFNTIKPISAQIPAKISIIRDTPYIDVQMFCDESAHFLGVGAAPICSPY
jgi:hypothetical protein